MSGRWRNLEQELTDSRYNQSTLYRILKELTKYF